VGHIFYLVLIAVIKQYVVAYVNFGSFILNVWHCVACAWFGGDDVLIKITFLGSECEIGDFERWLCKGVICRLMVVEAFFCTWLVSTGYIFVLRSSKL